MIDPEKMRLFMQAMKPDFLGLARQVFIENPQTALRELPGKLQASRDLLNQYEPGKNIDPRLMDQFMNLTGFAPAGTITGATKDVIRSLADDLASQLEKLGFQANVHHSGSMAGPSSYVRIFDPQTGRFFTDPIRFSGHGKGPKSAAEVIEIQDVATDIPKIIQQALQMRELGQSQVFQKQAIVNELISFGMKPKDAYKEAEKRLKTLLD